MKRLLSWLLVLTMLVACLPMSVIPALAVETDVDTSEGSDLELPFDELLPTEPEFGTAENPLELVEGENEFTVIPGTIFHATYPNNGKTYIMTVTGSDSFIATQFMRNNGSGDAENPVELTLNNEYAMAMGFGLTFESTAEVESVDLVVTLTEKVINPGEDASNPIVVSVSKAAPLSATANITAVGASVYYAVTFVDAGYVKFEATNAAFGIDYENGDTLTVAVEAGQTKTLVVGNGEWKAEAVAFTATYLTDAEIADIAAAEAVTAQINALTDLDMDTWETILAEGVDAAQVAEARAAYEALSDGAKALVEDYIVNKLAKAEELCHVYSFAATGGIAPFLSLEDEVFLMLGFDMYQDGVKLNANTITENILSNFGVAVWAAENKPADEDCVVENAEYCLGDAYWHATNKRITLRTAGIPAKNMGDAIAFRPFYKNADGTYTYGRIIASYSPRTYAESNANKTSNGVAFRNLMVALMNYGAAAQEFFSYKTDDMMNAAWTDAQKQSTWDASWVRSEYDVSKGAGFVRDTKKVTSRTGNLTLEGAITVNLYAKVSFTVAKATAYYWTEEVYNSVDTLTLENAVKSEVIEGVDSQGRWAAGYDGVAAKDLFNTVYSMIVFEDTDGNVHYTGVAAYSAERYAYLNKDKTDTASELARRLACYSKAAQAYFFGQ